MTILPWHRSWGPAPAIVRPRPAPKAQVYPLTKIDRTLKMTCLMFGVTVAELRGPCRFRHLVHARRYAAYMLVRVYGLSLPQAGRVLNRHHTTVFHHLCALGRDG